MAGEPRSVCQGLFLGDVQEERGRPEHQDCVVSAVGERIKRINGSTPRGFPTPVSIEGKRLCPVRLSEGETPAGSWRVRGG